MAHRSPCPRRAIRSPVLAALALAACGWGAPATPPTYDVEGTVLSVPTPDRLIVDHEAIPGFMDAMVMPFDLAEPSLSRDVRPGDRIAARLVIRPEGAVVDQLRVTGHEDPPAPSTRKPLPTILTTDVFPSTDVPVTGGETWTIGDGAGVPTLLTFLYTRCPLPQFCPATVLKLQEIQAGLARTDTPARILAVTIDPERDTLAHLATYGEGVNADPVRWRFGRMPDPASLIALADRAGLEVHDGPAATVEHNTRYLVLTAEGVVLQRYFDNDLDPARVVRQLTTGRPRHDEERDDPIFPYGGAR